LFHGTPGVVVVVVSRVVVMTSVVDWMLVEVKVVVKVVGFP
jgi:hypothetical protein